MKSMIVGQIHDSIIADVPSSEMDDFLSLAKDVMINQLTEEWKWINRFTTTDSPFNSGEIVYLKLGRYEE